MKKLLIFVAVVAALVHTHAGRAATCGLPDTKPLWVDFTDGTVPWGLQTLGKPGITIATTGLGLPPQFRSLGAGTAYWEMHLGLIVGTTLAPTDPATVTEKAQKLFDRAAGASGCPTPYIALNELNGASTTTPWTTNNAAYRANVLSLMQQLAAKGARPFLLVNSALYTVGDG